MHVETINYGVRGIRCGWCRVWNGSEQSVYNSLESFIEQV